MALLQHDVCDLAPLFPGGIYAGRVVGAGVEEEDGAVGSGGKDGEELVAGETDGLGIVILVSGGLDSDVSEDSKMVYCRCNGERSGVHTVRWSYNKYTQRTPRWVTDKNLLGSVEDVEPAEEQGGKMVGPGARDRLDADDPFLGDRGRICTQDETGGGGGEFWKTGDREVLVVEGRVVQQDLSGLPMAGSEC